jgi:hypothetical protein
VQQVFAEMGIPRENVKVTIILTDRPAQTEGNGQPDETQNSP